MKKLLSNPQWWQAWAAVGAVIVAVLALLVSVGVIGSSRTPEKKDPPGAVVETIAGDTPVSPADGFITPVDSPPRPTNTPSPPTDTPLSAGTLATIGDIVFVPAGDFTMGSPEGEGSDSEHPQHTVYLDAFYIDKTEVTNAMFAQFVEETGYHTDAEKAGSGYVYDPSTLLWSDIQGADWRHPRGPSSSLDGLDAHPVVQVSWNDAAAYCGWAGKRLPTEAEWEKAARGTDGRVYPWGNDWDVRSVRRLNFSDKNDPTGASDTVADDGYATTAPVGSYPAGASPYGALDMVGNVWEWVADWYSDTYYDQSPGQNPTGPVSGSGRVLRGGSWFKDTSNVRAYSRSGPYDPGIRLDIVGVRCARS